MKKTLKYLSFFFLIVFSVSCAKIELTPKFVFFTFLKRASLEKTSPDGFFQFGFMLSEKDKALFTASTYKNQMKRIEILAPNGQKYQIDPQMPYNTSKKDYWQGFMQIGLKDQQLLWLGSDFSYNQKNLPPEGKYTVTITSKSGDVSVTTYDFKANTENQINSYIDNLKYDVKTRTAVWKPVKEKNVYYRLYVIKGEKKDGVEDWANLVYATRPTMVPEPKFVLPDEVKLEKGQKYYIMVESWRIPYFSVQDRVDKVAAFVASE